MPRIRRERRAAARVAVHLRQHQPVDADPIGERLADPQRFLPGHAVDDEQDLVRAHDALQHRQLVHQRLVDLQPPGGVEHQEIEPAPARLVERARGDRLGCRPIRCAPETRFRLRGHALELVDRRRTIDVGARQHRALALLAEPQRQLPGEGRLARALKAREQEDRRQVRRARQGHRRLAEQLDQLVVHDPDDLLARREALQHLVADRPLFHAGDELLHHVELDVRFEQCAPDFPQ